MRKLRIWIFIFLGMFLLVPITGVVKEFVKTTYRTITGANQFEVRSLFKLHSGDEVFEIHDLAAIHLIRKSGASRYFLSPKLIHSNEIREGAYPSQPDPTAKIGIQMSLETLPHCKIQDHEDEVDLVLCD